MTIKNKKPQWKRALEASTKMNFYLTAMLGSTVFSMFYFFLALVSFCQMLMYISDIWASLAFAILSAYCVYKYFKLTAEENKFNSWCKLYAHIYDTVMSEKIR